MTNHHAQPVARRAFTLVELMVTIAIIALLLGILIPALSGAFGNANRAKSQTHLNTMVTAIEAFNADFQFDPPLVAPPKDGRNGSPQGIRTPELRANDFADFYGATATNTVEAYQKARYYSEYSLTVYLLGIGDLNGDQRLIYDDRATSDRIEPNLDDGLDGVGIRHPGEFRAWKKRDPNDNTNFVHQPAGVGREYGPYIDKGFMKDVVKEVKIGINGRPDPNGPITMYTLVDLWGTPYRYYRNWPTRRTVAGREVGSVARVPVELRNPDSVIKQIEGTGISNEDGAIVDLDRDALTARFMVIGAGAKPEDVDASGAYVAPFGDVILNPDNATRETLPVDDENFNINSLDGERKATLRSYIKKPVRAVP